MPASIRHLTFTTDIDTPLTVIQSSHKLALTTSRGDSIDVYVTRKGTPLDITDSAGTPGASALLPNGSTFLLPDNSVTTGTSGSGANLRYYISATLTPQVYAYEGTVYLSLYIKWTDYTTTTYAVIAFNCVHNRSDVLSTINPAVQLLTTAQAVTIAQGGTGAASALGARRNLNETYEPGTYTLTNIMFYGFVSGNGATCRLAFDTSKSTYGINSITIDSLQIAIRTTDGAYLDGNSDSSNWVGRSGVTVACAKTGYYEAHINMTKTSAFSNVTNNTPVIGFGTVTMTLST